MNPFYCDPFAKIWTDGHSPVLFIRLLKIPKSPEEKSTLAEMYTQSLCKLNTQFFEAYCVFDFSETPSTEVHQLPVEQLLFSPKGMENSIKAAAVIMPANYPYNICTFLRFGKDTASGAFKSFYEGLRYINQLRQEFLLERVY